MRRSFRDFRAARDPAWRWNLAKSVHERGGRLRGIDDPYVRDFVKFLRIWHNPSRRARGEDEKLYPELLWAYQIRMDGLRGARYYLEAMAVAGAAIDEIAALFGLPTQVVLAYEKIFFAIRDCSTDPRVLRAHVLSRIDATDLQRLHPDSYWKTIALLHGPQALLSLWGRGVSGAESRASDEWIARCLRQSAQAALHARQPDHFNAHEIIEEWLAMRRLELDTERSGDGVVGAGDTPAEFAATLLSYIRFSLPVQNARPRIVEMAEPDVNTERLLRRLQGGSEREHDEDSGTGGEDD